MAMKRNLLICFLFIFGINVAQVGIGTTSPSATLDIPATNPASPQNNEGILIPRMSTFPSVNPTAIQNGMLVFLTTTTTFASTTRTPGFYYWDNATTNWIAVGSTLANDWALTGNAGTNPSTNFIGTTDNQNVVFRRNNIRAGFIGDAAFNAITFDSQNGNTSFGANSLVNPTVNVASQTGVRNSAFGVNALTANTTGQRNTAVGDFTLFSNTTGSENTAIGAGALFTNTISGGHVAIGRNALTSFNGVAGTIGNTAIGFAALRNTTSGVRNVALGYEALRNGTTASGNIGIGYRAGRDETNSNRLYIENSEANQDNALIYGEFDTNIVRVNGILQISNPAGTFGYAFPSTRGLANQVLQTNGAGATAWVNASSLSVTETDPQVSSSTANAIPRWNGTTLVDGTLVDDGTNLGIGMSPLAGNKLDVNGKTRTTNFQMTAGANNGFYLQSDATGNGSWVTSPLNNLSVVRVNLVADQSLTTAGWQKINFDNEIFDTGSEFNPSTGRFTATKAGFYQITASLHTNNQSNGQFYSIGIRINGNFYQQTSANHFGNGPVDRAVMCLANLQVGDFVEVFVENYQTGVSVDSFFGKTVFEIQQIR